MKSIRRHVRAWATTWLVVQALSLSVFVPRDCCAAHSQHRMPAPQTAADDPACPMHSTKAPDPECRLKGTCNGPMLALPLAPASAALVSASFAILPDVTISPSAVLYEAQPTVSDLLSDTPPPRA